MQGTAITRLVVCRYSDTCSCYNLTESTLLTVDYHQSSRRKSILIIGRTRVGGYVGFVVFSRLFA
jgi:hypothetical protein